MLGVVSLFTDTASEMIYPLIPIYVSALGSGPIMIGIIEGIAETTASILKFLSGIISDKIGKRKLLVVIGYTVSTIARPLTGIVSSAWQIILIRMTDRIGKGIRTAPRDALIASYANENIRGKSFGFHRAMDHTGAVLGPILAILILLVLINSFNISDSLTALRWTFLVSIFPGILAVLTIMFFVKEAAPKIASSALLRFRLKEFDKNFSRYLFILVLFALGNSSDAFLLYRVNEAIRKSGAVVEFVREHIILENMVSIFGNTEKQAELINILFLPLVWGFFHIIKAFFSTPLSALSDKIGRKVTIIFGWTIYTSVYVSFALIVFLPSHIQIPVTFVLFTIYALFYAFTEGTEKALVADMVPEEKRGTAFGMYNLATGVSTLPASIIFGFLYTYFEQQFPGYGGTFAFGFGGSIALLSMILFSFLVKAKNR